MERFICKICGEVIESRLLSTVRMKSTNHLRMKHNMIPRDYLIKFECNGEAPKCACGCGKEVGIDHWTWNKYASDTCVSRH